MPLLETLIATVAPAIAKTVLKVWAADDVVATEAGTSAVEALTKLIPEIRARKEAQRQLAAIGEKAAESLTFIFETEGKQLLVDDQDAVAKLVAQTLDSSRIKAELLVDKDLDPIRLAQYFIACAAGQLVELPEYRVHLFTRVIEEACQSIIDIARVLPNFSERTFAELLRRDRVLIDAAQRTLDNLDRIRSQADEYQQAEAAKFETEYRRAIIRNLNKVELFGVDLSRASRSHPLSVAYVSLDVASSPGALGELANQATKEEEDEDDDQLAVQTVETALAENTRLLVEGPAGAGKTTLVHWIAVRAASGDFEYPLEKWNAALPFIIRLRQFGDSPFPRPEEFPSLVAPTIADTMPRGWVHEKLSCGHAVVMVDGVDEVAESRRGEVRKWLKELVETFPKCRFIVTSRPHAVEQGWLETEGFGEADLQPMDTTGIEKFVDHWHLAVADEVQREEEIDSLERLAQNLKTTLRNNRSIRRLTTNPLLCSVICALHRDTNEQLPQDRLDLYERCCSMLLERRDPESGLRITGYPRLSYRQKRSLVDDLAYWMLKNEWSEISIAAARDRFDKKIETLRSDSDSDVPLTGHNVLRFFVERSGILRQPLEGKLDFAHRTFQEFMAATAAVAEGDIGVLLANATNPQWREVIVLGAGLARPGERNTLIRSLLSGGDGDPKSLAQLHLMAAACLDTAVDVDSELRGEVESRIESLFPPKNVSMAMQIADAAGEMAVPFLRLGNRYHNARQSAACVRALAMIGSLEAVQAIADYAGDHSSLVLNEVVRASDRIDSGLFLDMIAPRLDARRLPGAAVALALSKFGIDVMRNLEDAEELSLSGARAQKLSILRCLPKLRRISLSGPAIRDLNPLRLLRNLVSLNLASVGVYDLSALSGIEGLEYLWLRHLSVDARQLRNMKKLKLLDLWGGAINNAAELQKITSLRKLSFYNVKADLVFFENMRDITALSLDVGPGTELTPLRGLRSLESLTVYFSEISSVQWLANLTRLETLEFYGGSIIDPSTFPPLPKLQKLSLRLDQRNPELLTELRRKYPGVRILMT